MAGLESRWQEVSLKDRVHCLQQMASFACWSP